MTKTSTETVQVFSLATDEVVYLRAEVERLKAGPSKLELLRDNERLRAAIQRHRERMDPDDPDHPWDIELWAALEEPDFEKPCHVDSGNVRAATSVKVKPECSICRRRHGPEVEHACE